MSEVFAGVWWLGSCSGGSLGVGLFSLFAGYLGLARVFVWDSALRLDCRFSGVFASIGGVFLFCGGNRHWATVLWSLDTFLIFRATCESACKYHVYK